MVRRSKSSLLLIEQIIVIAIFAVCAAVCINIIARAYLMTEDAVNTRYALAVAESAAESFKAFDGDTDRVFDLVGTYFDDNWRRTNPQNASFVLRVNPIDEGNIVLGEILIQKISDASTLVELEVATRRVVLR